MVEDRSRTTRVQQAVICQTRCGLHCAQGLSVALLGQEEQMGGSEHIAQHQPQGDSLCCQNLRIRKQRLHDLD